MINVPAFPVEIIGKLWNIATPKTDFEAGMLWVKTGKLMTN
jgi:hypothetical protein|tara:strand:- start:36051 stop:36173 length:123 start_codon:yes stop_codon:yes gene_type:complete